jgi:dTDP-4-dehydrorhamnose 3,5-epimerase-like enzyme
MMKNVKNVFVIEKEQFYDENGWFVTVWQKWHAFYDDLKIVINSS